MATIMERDEHDTAQVDVAGIDPITFEVIRHRLWAINDDQGRMAARLSGAPIVFDSYDFNAAIVTADGRGLYTGVYIMQHGSTIDEFVRRVLAEWPPGEIHPGDMFYTNDPWWGALHANDGILVMPVFYDGQLVAWSGIVMHDNDVGGPVPGSFVVGAKDRYGEAPLYPAVKIVEGYEIRADIERVRLRNSRTPELVQLNMRARMAGLRSAEQRIGDLIRTYGLEVFLAAQEGILEYVERVLRRRLAAIPDGSWFAEGYHDHDGNNPEIYPICCRVTKQGDHLTFDMAGTAPQAEGPINCARPALEGAIVGIVLTLLCYDLPWAVGAVRKVVDIVAVEGTLNNAVSPAAVSMASFMATLSTQDVVTSAVAKMLLSSDRYRGEAQATWAPGMNGVLLVTLDRAGEEGYNFVTDSFGGGGGARSFTDGIDSGGIFHSMGSRIANVEAVEGRGAFLQLYRRQVRDSGGPGRFRGGVSIEFASLPHKAVGSAFANVTATGVAMPAGLGLAGGFPGSAASNVVLRGTDARARFAAGALPTDATELCAGSIEVLEAKSLSILGEDDLCVSVLGPGAGFGDPLRRDPALVATDVARGLVSPEWARRSYGVVLDERGQVDPGATEAERGALGAGRLRAAAPVVMERPRRVLEDGTVLHPLGDTVEAILADGERKIRCTVCHQDLGPYTEDYKASTVMLELTLTALGPLNEGCQLDRFVVRQFCCPGCGTSVAADVQEQSEPVREEARLFDGTPPSTPGRVSA